MSEEVLTNIDDVDKIEEAYDKYLDDSKELEAVRGISDFNVERAILSNFIDNQEQQQDFLAYKMSVDMFNNKMSKAVFLQLQEACVNSKPLDFLLLIDQLSKESFLEAEINDYFTFTTFEPVVELLPHYVKSLKHTYNRKQLLWIISKIKESIEKRDDKVIAWLKHELESFSFSIEDEDSEIGIMSNTVVADEMLKFLEGDEEMKQKNEPLFTGYKSLDEATGWFERGNMIVLGARPSIGKSMAMINIMEQMHSQGYKVMYFSQEMYARYVYRRIISRNLKINSKKLSDPDKLTETEKNKIKKYLKDLKSDTTRHIYYNNDMSSVDIYAAAKQIKQKYWLDAIFIDYLGKIEPNSRIYKGRSTNEIITEVSKQIFRLWPSLNVAVFTASQLSRWGEKNNTEAIYQPKMSDLRDSGSIEQDADIIFGLSMDRDEKNKCYLDSDCVDYHFTWLKNRNGSINNVVMSFYPTIWTLKDKLDEETTIIKENKVPTPSLLKTDWVEEITIDGVQEKVNLAKEKNSFIVDALSISSQKEEIDNIFGHSSDED